ncbi:MAG: hypothetical protein A2X12_07340 [Bacteroidetes bacterium GWE2_29_8]|nr:MAG: hypothetical protein A2X12_07340 [Bacteroidetes bacterium GWE2_29_8]OFY24580.1 MAG: hypothetical protein A2X02_03180 [Bacteroidetes bacterium GWF2_29_10]
MGDSLEVFVSVIIPAFNRENTISYCLDSVLNQTYQNFEIIVIDDYSNDNTINILNNYSGKDKRISIIKLDKRSGAQYARNKGIEYSKYEWIAFLDSDDKWEHNKLELQVDVIKQHNFEKLLVIHTDCYYFDQVNDITNVWNTKLVHGANAYKRLLEEYGPTFPSILTSKEALLKINLLDINTPSYQEWDTSISLAKICNFHHIQLPLFTYIIHSEEAISKNKTKDIDGYLYIINKYKEEIIKINGISCWEKHVEFVFRRSIDFELWEYALKIKKLYINLKNENISFLLFCLKNKTKPEISHTKYNAYKNKLYKIIIRKIIWKIRLYFKQ